MIREQYAPYFRGFSPILLIAGVAFATVAQEDEKTAPTYPIPVRPPMYAFEGMLPSVELVGIDLEQKGHKISGVPAQIAVGVPLEVTLHLRPISRRIEDSRLNLNIREPGVGEAPSFPHSFDWELANWKPSETYLKTYTMKLPRSQFVGPGALRVTESVPGGKWQDDAVLYALPVNLPAAVWASTLRQRYVDAAFGTNALRVEKAFRLGPETSVTVNLPRVDAIEFSGIGIVSSTSWDDNIPRGTTLADIAPGIDARPRWGVRYGTETYRRRATADEVATLPSTAKPVLEKIPTDDGELIDRYFFAHVLDLDDGSVPRTLQFRYAHDTGMWDVAEIVLIPATDAER